MGIFYFAYQSYKEASDKISNNAKIRKKNQNAKKIKANVETEIELAVRPFPGSNESNKSIQNEHLETYQEQEIEPVDEQIMMLLLESIFESIPQVILQSVFLIRSKNDETLKADISNEILLLLSVFASLMSISNKFTYDDKECVVEKAESLKPKESFPNCVQYWAIIRVLWRFFDVASRFTTYVLIWVVMGGIWLPIWTGLSFIIHFLYNVKTVKCSEKSTALGAVLQTLSWIVADELTVNWLKVIPKYLDKFLILIATAIFGFFPFSCSICADFEHRKFLNHSNDGVLQYFIIACISVGIQLFFYLLMITNLIIIDSDQKLTVQINQ
eukprot:550491_1